MHHATNVTHDTLFAVVHFCSECNNIRMSTSLRERKRTETWNALHEAAADLAMSHDGLGSVTVEAIVSRANVSARTFFNYFDTKEDAILGFREPRIDDEMLAGFLGSSGPLVTRVADFYFDLVQMSRTTGTGRQRRLAIVRRHPELTNRQFTHFNQVEMLITDAVLDHLESQNPGDHDNSQRADALVQASGAAHRVALRHASPSAAAKDDRPAMHAALKQLREVLQTTP